MIEKYAEDVSFFVPEVAFADAQEHLLALVVRRGGAPQKALALLHALRRLVEVIGSEVYGSFEMVARERLEYRDSEDWPILAAALAIGCPIWTETTISSAVVWPHGRQALLRASFANEMRHGIRHLFRQSTPGPQ